MCPASLALSWAAPTLTLLCEAFPWTEPLWSGAGLCVKHLSLPPCFRPFLLGTFQVPKTAEKVPETISSGTGCPSGCGSPCGSCSLCRLLTLPPGSAELPGVPCLRRSGVTLALASVPLCGALAGQPVHRAVAEGRLVTCELLLAAVIGDVNRRPNLGVCRSRTGGRVERSPAPSGRRVLRPAPREMA